MLTNSYVTCVWFSRGFCANLLQVANILCNVYTGVSKFLHVQDGHNSVYFCKNDQIELKHGKHIG